MDAVPLVLFLLGIALFVVGDVLWLLRNTFSRPMQIQATGGLVGGGVLLMMIGLLVWALTAGDS